MFRIFFFILYLTFFQISLIASYSPTEEKFEKSYVYKKIPYIDDFTWYSLSPLFFPHDHALKRKVDEIFSHGRITTNAQTIEMAGFKIIGKRVWDKALVLKHPKLKGLIFKMYLDDHIGMNETYFLVNRIKGATLIRNAIKEYGFEKYFCVPKKWIYPLPDFPVASCLERKTIILIEEEIKIVSEKKNKSMFYNVDVDHLAALYHMISTLGLSDSVFIKNVPFTKDGKMAFIDTERFHLWNIRYKTLTPSLRPEMQQYWTIITNGK